jgi:hypothetical protein
MGEDLAREEVVAAIDRVIEELLERAGVQAPPVDAIALARRQLGLAISLDRPQRPRGRTQGRARIFLRPEPTEERDQWAVAHEIARHLKPALLERLGVEPQAGRGLVGESLGKLFAGRLLVPACWFGADAAAADYDVPQLKQRYRTASHETVALRLLDLPEPCIITVVDNGHVSRRRSNAWRVRRELAPAEQECQRYVNTYGRQKLVVRDGWTVRGWPVHQPDWKREILRSVVDDDAEWGAGPREAPDPDDWGDA